MQRRAALLLPLLLAVARASNSQHSWFSWGTGRDQASAFPSIDDTTQRVTVVTTACLPWMTGTAVNPALRAAYLAVNRPAGFVTLMVPWVDEVDQERLFPKGLRFANEDEHRAWIVRWFNESANLPAAADKLQIHFYYGRYHPEYGCIFSMGSMLKNIPNDQKDICILEEPEHLNWYRFPEAGWLDTFKYVVGIVHTNYLGYANKHKGPWAVPFVWMFSQWMCRSYCHTIIKLSDTLQSYAPEKEVVCNVHGVRAAFLEEGRKAGLRKHFPKGAYFVGKQLWAKGFDLLFSLMKSYRRRSGGDCFEIDLYGSGPDSKSIEQAAKRSGLPVNFMGFGDHASLTDYKVFVNPSVTEVLCTTVAEALAMGKWVVCPRHPSNDFFRQFASCLQYEGAEEFAAAVHWALHHDPPDLLPEMRYALTWAAAMDRLAAVASPGADQSPGQSVLDARQARSKFDRILEKIHAQIGAGRGGDVVRKVCGALTVADQVAYERASNALAAAAAAEHSEQEEAETSGDSE